MVAGINVGLTLLLFLAFEYAHAYAYTEIYGNEPKAMLRVKMVAMRLEL